MLAHMYQIVQPICVELIQIIAGPKGRQDLGSANAKKMYLNKWPSEVVNQDWILLL